MVDMEFQLPLLAVDDVERSKKFYGELFDQTIIEDYGENVVFSGGFAVQEKFDWLTGLSKENILKKSNNMELYFETEDLDGFIEKLKKFEDVELVHELKQHSWQQRVIRLYDPDGHIIEVGESLMFVAERLMKEGRSIEEAASITQQSLEQIKKYLEKKAKTPILETERLILRPLTKEDAQAAYENWASDPEVTKYLSWNRHETIEDTLNWLEIEEKNFKNENIYDFGFVLKETGELIGSGGLYYNQEYGKFELGYNIMKKYWNQGYTTEAAERILKFGVEEKGIREFLGRHAKENPASGKVMEKVGFHYERAGEYYSVDKKKRFDSREYFLSK